MTVHKSKMNCKSKIASNAETGNLVQNNYGDRENQEEEHKNEFDFLKKFQIIRNIHEKCRYSVLFSDYRLKTVVKTCFVVLVYS